MTTRRKLKIGVLALGILLLLCLIAAGISAIVCSKTIKVTSYDVSLEGIEHPVKIVAVADLHGKIYGNQNDILYENIRSQEPDAIVLLGDLFPSKFVESDLDYVLDLTRDLQEMAQVYFAMGNHETSYTRKYGESWISEVAAAGALVLDEDWENVEIGGNIIRLGGTMGHGYLFGRTLKEFKAAPEYHVLYGLEHSPYPAILLSHMPDTVALSDGKQRWHIDLVLSGHTHGGIIRIPGIGGLYAPMQGWWPSYDYGEFLLNDQMRMIITSGLSGHDTVPRIFNLPEICVIHLEPQTS